MRQASTEPIPKERRAHVDFVSPAVFIYTSGTTGDLSCSHWFWHRSKRNGSHAHASGFSRTGLPKAAEINQGKLWAMSSLMSVAGARSSDVIYTSLPLYHSAAFLGFTSTIERGTHTVTCTLANGGGGVPFNKTRDSTPSPTSVVLATNVQMCTGGGGVMWCLSRPLCENGQHVQRTEGNERRQFKIRPKHQKVKPQNKTDSRRQGKNKAEFSVNLPPAFPKAKRNKILFSCGRKAKLVLKNDKC